MLLKRNGVELETSDKFLEKCARKKLAKEAVQRNWVVKLSRIPENKLKNIQKNGRGFQNDLDNKRKRKVKQPNLISF